MCSFKVLLTTGSAVLCADWRILMRWNGSRMPFARRSGSRTGSVAWMVTAVVTAVAVGVSVAGSAQASAPMTAGSATRAAAKPQAAPVVAKNDLVSARIAAKTQQRPVEVVDERTESSTTWALPNGSLRKDMNPAPVRVQRGDGSWAPIDLDLVKGKDGWAPKTSPRPVTFSAGGSGPAVVFEHQGRGLSMGWDGRLAEPTISGATATYAVSPSKDLVLTARLDGFEQSVVIKDRPAAGDRVEPVTLPLTLDGTDAVTVAGGGITFEATKTTGKGEAQVKAGDDVFAVQAPVMYSAATDTKTGEHTQVQEVTTKLAQDPQAGVDAGLTLTPDAGFLADPKTVFPVTIDPVISAVDAIGDTWVRNGDAAVHGGEDHVSAGIWGQSWQNSSALIKFDDAQFQWNHVTSASLNLFNSFSGSCTSNWVGVYPLSEDFNPATVTYDTSPGIIDDGHQVWRQFSHGFDASCPGASESFDVTSTVSDWAFGNFPNYGFAIFADTTGAEGRKSFCSLDVGSSGDCSSLARVPTLSVTYNSYPWPPQEVSFTPNVLGTTGLTYSSSRYPRFQAKVGNTDGAPVSLAVEVSYDPAFPGDGSGAVWSGTGTAVAPLSVATVKQTLALSTGKHYQYRVRGAVTTNAGGTDTGPWSGYQTFVVNSSAPAAPTISCGSYPANAWTASTGGSVSCTLDTTSTDGSGYFWGLDDPSVPTVQNNGTNTGAAQSISINPAAGLHTLYARARDTALLSSATTEYTFGVGVGGVITPASGSQTEKAVALSAQSSSARTQVSYEYRPGTDASLTWQTVPLANVTPPGSSTPITAWQQPGTVSGSVTSYSPLNWNVAATISAAGGSEGIVQVRACFTQAGANNACSGATTFTLAKTAFSPTAATADLGPGEVSLVTGDFAVDESDVSVAGLSIARTHTSLGPVPANTGPSGVFGAGWTVSAFGPPAGAGDMSLDDQSAKGYVVLTDSSGTKSTYVKNGTIYSGVGDAADGSTLAKSTTIQNPSDSSDATTYTGWQLRDLDGTLTSYLQLGTSSVYMSKWVDEAGKEAESTYTRDGNGRITRILAPIPAGVTCTTMVAGCQALNITYAASTTATGTGQSAWGDYTGLVKQITYTGYDPATAAMTTIAVSAYQYDNTGHLRAQWDPRISPGLVTTYTYQGDGRILTVDAPGRGIWVMGYDTTGRLNNVARTDPANGNAQQSVAYDIPLSGTGAPIDMSLAQTSTWNQTTDLPYVGAAVFPASHVPGSNANGVLTPNIGDYVYADLTYVDIEGRAVNTASNGAGAWQIASTRYDSTGNTVWELSDRNRAQALTPTEDTDPYVESEDSSAARADLLSTQSVYSEDGVDLLSTTGPAHQYYLASGTLSSARVRTSYTYDQGAPAGGPYHLVTTTTTASVPLDGAATTAQDTVVKLTGYAPIDGASTTGPTSGWVLKLPTTQTTVMDTSPGSSDIVTKTRYDDASHAVETRMPLSDGTDAGTTLTTYYTAAANTTTPACGTKPQWAGAVCKSEPKAQPAGTTIPSDVTTYTIWGATDTVVETSGTSTRTSDTDYDAAGRVIASSVVASPAADGGTALPNVTTAYSATTGDPISVTSAGATISTGYDSIGRQTSYTDADGTVTAMTYTIDGQVRTRSDGKGTYTYTYDGTDAAGKTEHRGLLTSLDVGMGSAPSTFTAAYDEGGNLVKQVYPNGIIATTTYDNTDDPRGLHYTNHGDNWMFYDSGSDRDGHTVWSGGPMSLQHYGYDNASRLTYVSDNVNGACTTRQYTFSRNGNRTALTTGAAPDTMGTCQTSTTTTASSTYDTADRITNSGYTYDKFGRTLTTPATDVTGGAALTAGYYTDDKVATLTQATNTKTFTLDPARRLRQVTDTTSGTETRRIINHYPDTEDSPSWISTSTDAGATTTWERNVEGIDGNLAAIQPSTGTIQIQLTNLHGDVVATVDNDSGAVSTNAYFEQTEYGTPRTENTTNPARYGWLGSKQRSADTLAGIVLMGVRLYNPTTGRFLSTDPVPGGNENAYNYPNDPINMFDLDGRWGFKSVARWTWKHRSTIALASTFVCQVCAAAYAGYSAYRAVQYARRGDWNGAAWSAAGALKLKGLKGFTKAGARAERKSGRIYASRQAATRAAKKYAGKRKSCNFRDVCKSGDHVHVDRMSRSGRKVHTRHYYW